MLAIDTETTGIDFQHGARPFLVTTCDDEGTHRVWEWGVNPLTRVPQVPIRDLEEIYEIIHQEDHLVLQNSKFDVAALGMLFEDYGLKIDWPWDKTHDTLIAAHLLASSQPRDLTSLALQYLQVDVEPYEKALRQACLKSRDICRSQFPGWAVAKAGRPDMPSAGKETWKFDTWLPRVLAQQMKYPENHPWWTITSRYANSDSAVTVALGAVMIDRIGRRGLGKIYHERMKTMPITLDMERRGVTVSMARLRTLRAEYGAESRALEQRCVEIASSYGYVLNMPKGSNNDSLKNFCFAHKDKQTGETVDSPLNLPVFKRSKKTGDPSLDKYSLEFYIDTLPPDSGKWEFCECLQKKRKGDVALSYMESYERFWRKWVPHNPRYRSTKGWYVLYPHLNPTGTKTLRWSSKNPNEQNIAKKKGFNLRYGFGPAPGREWWSLDAKNLELRIPAYEAEEEEMIALFERPKDPPYFGSNHLLIAHVLHPKEFEECLDEDGMIDGRIFKERYESTLYQRTKNGNFAVQYGAVDREDGQGTADRTYGIQGAQARISARFRKQDELNKYWIRFAERNGYVETIPDKSVDYARGYPLMCTRTDYGKIKPTVPLNYHVQGTACWWIMKAMIRCEDQLLRWRKDGWDGFMTMQVHDELVFDLPCGTGPEPWKTNLPKMRRIKALMEQGGDDIGIPTPVSCDYHDVSWAEGKVIW